MTRSIAFVGPLPPPVHGFSNICATMLDRLRANSGVSVFDRAPRPDSRLGRLLQFAQPLEFFAVSLVRGFDSMYMGMSGGLGQVIDCVYVLCANVSKQQVFIHHHSFAYINRPSWTSRLLLGWTRNATHIVLSHGMGRAMAVRYGIDMDRIRVISNAAFFTPLESDAAMSVPVKGPLKIGFLANITFDKGFVEFFEVLASLNSSGVSYEAVIAGPIAVEAQATFDRLRGGAAAVRYAGPVYGEHKAQFFRDIQVLLFPTKYANEAEPLVIHEAMRESVSVIACDRGAIAEILQDGAGVVFPEREFVTAASQYLERLSADERLLAQMQVSARTRARRMQQEASQELQRVFVELAD